MMVSRRLRAWALALALIVLAPGGVWAGLDHYRPNMPPPPGAAPAPEAPGAPQGPGRPKMPGAPHHASLDANKATIKSSADDFKIKIGKITAAQFTVEFNNYSGNPVEPTDSELALLKKVMGILPPKYRTAVENTDFYFVDSIKNIAGNYGVLGLSGDSHIAISRGSFDTGDFSDYMPWSNDKEMMGTIIHEMTHTLVRSDPALLTSYVQMLEASNGHPWPQDANGYTRDPNAVSITNYGRKNPEEHMCEAAMFYFLDPETLKTKDRKTYDWFVANFPKNP